MKVDRSFFKQILFALGAVSVLAAYPLLSFGSREVIVAAVIGAVLSTINVLLGYLAVEYSFGKSYSTFLRTVLGGMGLRMLLLLGTLVVLVKVFGFHAVALTVSLLGFYMVYLALEVVFIQRKVITKDQE